MLSRQINSCVCCGKDEAFYFTRETLSFWKCVSCGSTRLHPQPSDSVLSEIYNYDYLPLLSGLEYKREKRKSFERYFRFLPSKKETMILDCGAGNGYFAEYALEKGYNIFAVEYGQAAAEKCRRLLGNKRVFESSIEDLKLPHFISKFDVITMFDFLEHVRSPRKVLQTAFSLLNPGGILLLTTPQMQSFLQVILKTNWPHFHREHLWYFSKTGLEMLLETNNFQIRKMGLGFKYVSIGYLRASLVKKKSTSGNCKFSKFIPKNLNNFSFWIWSGDMFAVVQKNHLSKV